MQVAESPVVAKLNGACSGGTGPDLTGYRSLTYAPREWGEGIRVASNGSKVEAVAESAHRWPIEIAASIHSVSPLEALDALTYARANGLI